jgi:hypothetical protein
MKVSGWVVYLFYDDKKKDIFKIMEFKTIKQVAYCLDIDPQTISNYFHGLIKPRGILKNIVLYQSVALEV